VLGGTDGSVVKLALIYIHIHIWGLSKVNSPFSKDCFNESISSSKYHVVFNTLDFGSCHTAGDALVHPGLLQSSEDFDRIKLNIAAANQPWLAGYQSFSIVHMQHPHTSQAQPQPFTVAQMVFTPRTTANFTMMLAPLTFCELFGLLPEKSNGEMLLSRFSMHGLQHW